MKTPLSRNAQAMIATWRTLPGNSVAKIVQADGTSAVRLAHNDLTVGIYPNETAAGRALIKSRSGFRKRQFKRYEFPRK